MSPDKRPQMRLLSTNTCPNAKRRGLTDPSMCDPIAMTTYGYCTECWDFARVPQRWREQATRQYWEN